ncbi:MAG: type II secretion system F family protein [Actinomycetota bacterium]|nr:type II secretion system F family protein [Actinomycetota bacterium]
MLFVVVGVCAWTTTSVVLARHVIEPYFFRRLVRRRLTPRRAARQRPLLPARRRAAQPLPSERHANALDAIGRELRLGSSLHAAVIAVVERQHITEWQWLSDASREGHMLGAVIRLNDSLNDASPDAALNLALRAIAVASEGGDAVHAVEAAARTLRVTATITAESRTAVAHTKASINVLTWVPLVLATWLIARDERARTFFVSTAGFACLLIGVALHWVGRRWVQRLTVSAARVDSDVPDFVDVVSVYLRSGQPPALAFLQASDTAPGTIGVAARAVAERVHNGERFMDVLTSLRSAFGLHAQPMIDALIDTERDGLAPRELFDRLATDAHAQRRRDADMRIRALPVRLTLPLVGCILPAYVLLAVVPLLASQLSSVNLDLP